MMDLDFKGKRAVVTGASLDNGKNLVKISTQYRPGNLNNLINE